MFPNASSTGAIESSRRTFDTEYASNFLPLQAPNFDDPSSQLHADHWADVLMRISAANQAAIDEEHVHFRSFMTAEAVQLIFTICVRLDLPHEVRYLALMIFDDFMLVQCERLYRNIRRSNDTRGAEGGEVEQREHALLRPGRPAGRLQREHGDQTLLLPNDHDPCPHATTAAATMNHMYTEPAIVKSDNRVFTAVMYKLNMDRNPATIMETFLVRHDRSLPGRAENDGPGGHLGVRDPLPRPHNKENSDIPVDRERTWRLESDFIVLALGVLSLSACAVCGEEFMHEVNGYLSAITGVDPHEIQMFASTLHELAVEQEAPTPTLETANELLGLKHINKFIPFTVFD
ncbi:hypothetical protein M3Y99_00037200 [Aphelenchoides fujianensis]|nr:hypothetical protein M3Y99_00037200 [Aphelenchoides fujianensis]